METPLVVPTKDPIEQRRQQEHLAATKPQAQTNLIRLGCLLAVAALCVMVILDSESTEAQRLGMMPALLTCLFAMIYYILLHPHRYGNVYKAMVKTPVD